MIDKIRKLLAKADDSAVSEAESEAFANRAFRMMEEHMISIEDVRREPTDYVTNTQLMKYRCGWREALADSVGRLMGAAFSYNPSSEYATFTGLQENTDAAWELYRYLDRQCILIPRTTLPTLREQRRAEKGVALGLCGRLYAIRAGQPAGRQLVISEHGNAEAARAAMMPNITPDNKDMKIDSKEAQIGVLLSRSVKINKDIEQ